MARPNFFIVGAARSGTSTLWRCLKEHPEIFMPEDELNKEPSFFSHAQDRLMLDQYLDIFSPADDAVRWVGEASTSYLTWEEAAQNIHRFNPEARIIIILRNPADRAYSLYRWMVQEGYEWAPSFSYALKLEERRFRSMEKGLWRSEYLWNYMYFSSGLYCGQVKRYLDFFGEKTLILRFEDMKNDFEAFYAKVCVFLDVVPNAIQKRHHNMSHRSFYPPIQYAMRKINDWIISRRGFRDKVRTKAERDFLVGRIRLPGRPHPMDKEIRDRLIERYRDEIIRLDSMVPFDTMAWLP